MSGSSRRHRRGPWPDLPSELLGLVLLRLPSHADRVRLSAVCRVWRSGARLQRPLPPVLPWLALPDGTFLSLPDGAVHRLRVSHDVSSRVSTGGALFLVHRDGRCSLTSPSSRASETTRPTAFPFRRNTIDKHRADNIVRKAVVSDRLVAVLKSTGRNNVVVSTTRGGGRRATTMEWTPPASSFTVDIALFKGKLYVLTADLGKYERELHVLDARDGQITSVCCIRSGRRDGHDHEDSYDDDPNDDDDGMCEGGGSTSRDDLYIVQRDYLVVSADQLLMVRRMMDSPLTFQRRKRTRWFEVFQAVGLGGGGRGSGRWIEVDTLKGRALFVSQGCSESLAAGGGCGGIGGVREDCIYFMNEIDKYTSMSKKKIYENPFRDAGVYSMRDRIVAPLVSSQETMAPLSTCDGPWSPTWHFPKT